MNSETIEILLACTWPFIIVLLAWLAYRTMIRHHKKRMRTRQNQPGVRRHGDQDDSGMALRAAPPQ